MTRLSWPYRALDPPDALEANSWITASSALLFRVAPVNDNDAPPHGERGGDSREAGQLVGRESVMERIRAFLATARTDGEAMLVTGEPGVGKTVLLDAASDAASALAMRTLRAAGVQFEAGTSFSGLNQVLLPLLGALPQLPAAHRNALNIALGFGTRPT